MAIIFQLRCCIGLSLVGVVIVFCQPLSVKNKVVIHQFDCWYFGNYVFRSSFLPHYDQQLTKT